MAFVQKFFTSLGKYNDGETRKGELNRLWYDSVTNTIRIGDGTPGGKIVSGGGLGSTVHEAATPPDNPKAGDMWWDTTDGNLYVYYDNTWVAATSWPNFATITYVDNAINNIQFPSDDDSMYVTEQFVNNAIDQVKDRLQSLNNLHTVVLDNTGVTTFGGDAVPSDPSYSLGTLTNPWKDVVVSDGSLIMKDSNPGVDPLYWANHLGYATLSRGGVKVRDNTNVFEIFQLDPSGKLILKSEQPLLSSSAAVQLIGNLSGNLLDPYNLGVMLQATGTQDIPSRVYIDGIGTQEDGTSAYAAFVGRHARGTSDTPTAVQEGDIIVRFGGNAYADTLGLDSKSNVRIDMIATENQTSTARGTEIQFWTTPLGTAVAEPTVHLDYNGIDFSNATSEIVGITFKDSSRLTTFPSQSGKDGKYLKVVGTTMSWEDVPTPAGAIIYKGAWDASSNTPTIADNTGTAGWQYVVTIAGTQDLGSGTLTFAVGDLVLHDGTKYDLIHQTSLAQVNADWNAITGVAQILNKPTLATVATSGSYLNLSDKPFIPAAQVNADWNATTGVAQILNKPTIPAAQVQSDWTQSNNAYPDYIKNKPSIPAAQLQSDWNQTNNASLDYIKNKPTIPAAQVQSDWNAVSGLGVILNKPTIPSAYTLPTATTSVLGGVKVDGTSITINNGVITAAGAVPYTLPTATTSVLGGVKIDGTSITINNGVISGNTGTVSVVSPTTLNSTTHIAGAISGNTLTISTDATTANTPSTLVVRDTNGNINVGAWTINTHVTTTNYTVTATDYWIGCTAKNLTITLPQTASQGRQYIIVDAVQSGNPGDTIVAAGGTTVVGGALSQQGQSKMCVFNGTTWYCN